MNKGFTGQALQPRLQRTVQGWGAYMRDKPYMPKFSGQSDPYYQQIASQIGAARDSDAAQRRQNIQQSLIAFGMVPEGLKDQYGDVDQGTRDAIAKNTSSGISTYARLLDARRESQTALKNRLNAHGLFRSGAKGHGLRKSQLDFDRSLADVMAQLMGNINSFNSSYANNELARQQALASALAQAYQNYIPPSTDPFSYIKTQPTGGTAPRVSTAPNYGSTGVSGALRLLGGM